VFAALGGLNRHVSHDDAVRIGRALRPSGAIRINAPLFGLFSDSRSERQAMSVPFVLSGTLYAGGLAAAVFVTTFGLLPTGATSRLADVRATPLSLVFLVAIPGPGGGGGGGLLQETPPPKAEREGRHLASSPAAPTPSEPRPEPPLKAEQLPAVVAPIVAVPADTRNRGGVLEQTAAENDSHGPGKEAGSGAGNGTGIGQGDGAGVGPGSGGGTGGGPYRPGSDIEPPKLLREVKADYTEDARVRGLSGDVVLEIVVQRDGSVGDVKLLQGLGGGLSDRAVQAVRQWRFSPAQRQGTPVDVVVEVAVEFKLR